MSKKAALSISISLLILVAVSGCATLSESIDTLAGQYQFQRAVVRGDLFEHVIYMNRNWNTPGRLHVYIEGDGRPWERIDRVSMDPTPTNPIALQLMSLDSAPSIYLGRPCYFGLARSRGCSPLIWTHRRYSEEVVSSLAQALQKSIHGIAYDSISLIGYSGGGVLAVLLAERVKKTTAVVTIVANLDIDAWAAHNGYSPLEGSINPLLHTRLADDIAQLHLVGGKDNNVLAEIGRRFVQRQGVSSSRLVLFDYADHTCCWQQIWPEFLRENNF